MPKLRHFTKCKTKNFIKLARTLIVQKSSEHGENETVKVGKSTVEQEAMFFKVKLQNPNYFYVNLITGSMGLHYFIPIIH